MPTFNDVVIHYFSNAALLTFAIGLAPDRIHDGKQPGHCGIGLLRRNQIDTFLLTPDGIGRRIIGYTGCHKYVPFAIFYRKQKDGA